MLVLFNVPVMLTRQPVEGQGGADLVLDPVGELRILLVPALDPGGEIALRLGEIPAVIEPAQLLQAVVVGLVRQVIQGISQEVNVAALPCRFGHDLGDRVLQPRMVVRDDEFHAP